jgi:hypothetical protein
MKTQLKLGHFISAAIVSLVVSSVVLAQSAPPAPRPETALIPAPLTKLETFAAKTGSLLATESYTLIGIYGGEVLQYSFAGNRHVRDRDLCNFYA